MCKQVGNDQVEQDSFNECVKSCEGSCRVLIRSVKIYL